MRDAPPPAWLERLAAKYHAQALEPLWSLWSLWQAVAGYAGAAPAEQPSGQHPLVGADYQPLVQLVLDTHRWWAAETVGREDENDVQDRGWVLVEDQDAIAQLTGARSLMS
ncbi:hypothetical protein [Kineococcus sp. SYSU DK005]|uniref:hypothetical protein n=1 Tax=Kineococcus sp. SYSU DK005 TaxID=3383126 RepID=UPI003D7D086E